MTLLGCPCPCYCLRVCGQSLPSSEPLPVVGRGECVEAAGPLKSPPFSQGCYCYSPAVKLSLPCPSHLISSCGRIFYMTLARTGRRAKNKQAVSPRRRTVCSRGSSLTFLLPLGPFNPSHPLKGKPERQRTPEQPSISLLHSPPPLPHWPRPPGAETDSCASQNGTKY